MEASEKNRARDKMIIKFREERIAELEARLDKAEEAQRTGETCAPGESCEDCASLRKQLKDAQKEIS